MRNGPRKLLLGALLVLLPAAPALAGDKPAAGRNVERASAYVAQRNAQSESSRYDGRVSERHVGPVRAARKPVRAAKAPDTAVVIAEADEREVRIAADSLRMSMRDPLVRSAVAKLYGNEALAAADANPRLLGMMNGDYSDRTVRLAVNLNKRIAMRTSQPIMAGKAVVDLDDAAITEAILDQIRTYAPVYYFHSQYDGNHVDGTAYCFPMTWSYWARNGCKENAPSVVPVYPSVTFRPERQGGGTFSYWINYHVFYGWQRGWIDGEHGDDWETTSVHIVNDRPVSVRYRVHGGAVTIYPWNSAPRNGDRHRVYVGTYFHGHYPTNYCRFGFGNTFGEFYKTWWDCRGDGIVIQPTIVPCSGFDRPSDNGDSCSNFSRNLFTEPRWSTKDEPYPKSSVPMADFDVPANVVLRSGQLCYTMGRSWKGIGDCTDASVPWIGGTMNDAISSAQWQGGVTAWKLYRHSDFEGTGWIAGEDDPEEDEVSSIRKL